MKRDIKLKNAKVLMLSTTDNMIWQFLIPHVKDLQGFGAQVDCVCSKTGFWFDELKQKFGFNMIEVPMKRKPINATNLKAYKRLKQLQKEKQYDLIYCQQPVGGMLGRFLGKKFKIPVIYTAHGFFFFKGNGKIKNLIYKTAEKYMARYTDILITMNQEDFEAAKKWKCKNVYNIHGIGLDEGKYDNSDFDKIEFKRSLGLQDDEKVILSVSEFIKRKNYETMLKSFAELAKTNEKVKYLLCGTGILLEEMKKLARELNIESKVLFLGYRKDVNKIMQIADVFFHQSFHEGLTMGIMEAMHFGLPVVTSDVRGNKDLIDDGLGGFITQSKDILHQVECLTKLLQDDKLRVEQGEYNKKRVKDFYLDSVREELKTIYKENGLLD